MERSESNDCCIKYKQSVPETGVAVSNTSNGVVELNGGEKRKKKV